MYDIYSITIGGAGSRHFTMTMRNHRCGYRIRESCYGETYTSKDRIRLLEKPPPHQRTGGQSAQRPTQNVLAYLNLDIVVIALGNNYVNDHQSLVNLIKAQSAHTQIICRPMLRLNLTQRMTAINQVVKKNSLFLVRSDDILGKRYPYVGPFLWKNGTKLGHKVAERMKTRAALCPNDGTVFGSAP